MEVHFLVKQPNGKAKKFKLNENEYIVIGRSSNQSQVTLEDQMCSSAHCKVFIKDRKVTIEDLNSKNGIFLNDVRVIQQRLYLQDKIKLGESILFMNEKRMDSESIKLASYKGDLNERLSNFTLELDNFKRGAQGQLQMHRPNSKVFSQVKEKRKKMSPPPKIDSYGIKNKFRNLGAKAIDLSIPLLSFILTMKFITTSNGDFSELVSEVGFLKALITGKILYISAGTIFFALIIHNINKRLPKGSLGEIVFRIN